jgi:hypothetical protein
MSNALTRPGSLSRAARVQATTIKIARPLTIESNHQSTVRITPGCDCALARVTGWHARGTCSQVLAAIPTAERTVATLPMTRGEKVLLGAGLWAGMVSGWIVAHIASCLF